MPKKTVTTHTIISFEDHGGYSYSAERDKAKVKIRTSEDQEIIFRMADLRKLTKGKAFTMRDIESLAVYEVTHEDDVIVITAPCGEEVRFAKADVEEVVKLLDGTTN